MFVSLQFKLELKKEDKEKPHVVFGGKRPFEKLCKNHLSGKAREKLKKQ